jgi:Dyp-type peroxidase family
VKIESQSVASTLSRAAIFLVATLNDGEDSLNAVRAMCSDLAGFVRAVGFRDLDGGLSCIMGFGSEAWDRLFGDPRPKELHPFREIHGQHHAMATPGDILFHIRARSMDLCFELAMQISVRLGEAVTVVDETHGFKFFDQRDMIGFVDGTENPTGQASADAALISDEDPAFVGGSYVIVQKYLHDLKDWNDMPVERQELIIGRKKLSDIELEDAVRQATTTACSISVAQRREACSSSRRRPFSVMPGRPPKCPRNHLHHSVTPRNPLIDDTVGDQQRPCAGLADRAGEEMHRVHQRRRSGRFNALVEPL